MNRWSAFLLTIVFCLIVAGAATKVAFSMASDSEEVAATPVISPNPTVMPSATPVPTPIPTPTPTPVQQRTAMTNGFVHMRADKSTSSAIIVDLQGGSTVVLEDDETSLWQAVSYGSYKGYVWKSYLNY